MNRRERDWIYEIARVIHDWSYPNRTRTVGVRDLSRFLRNSERLTGPLYRAIIAVRNGYPDAGESMAILREAVAEVRADQDRAELAPGCAEHVDGPGSRLVGDDDGLGGADAG